jgi:hypothetical protein
MVTRHSRRTCSTAAAFSVGFSAGSGGDAEGDRLAAVENLIGTRFDDILTGDAGDNVLTGGAGADAVDGGAGIDKIDFSVSADGVTVYLDGRAGQGGDAQGDTFANIEVVIGSAQGDRLVGAGAAEILRGGFGDDVIEGAGGGDIIDGGDGCCVRRQHDVDVGLVGFHFWDHLWRTIEVVVGLLDVLALDVLALVFFVVLGRDRRRDWRVLV